MNSSLDSARSDRSSSASRAPVHTVQSRLSVGPTNDSFEQEADRAASMVTGPSPAASAAATSQVGGGIQCFSSEAPTSRAVPNISRVVHRKVQAKSRDSEKEKEQAKLQRQEEEEAQPKVQRQEEEEPQAKLQRQEEEEAQARVQRQEEEEPQAKLQRQEEEEEAQAKVQRQEEEEAQPRLQRQEEEEPQAKLQRQEEEEAQPKVQRQEEEEAQTKLQRQEEEEVQSKPEARANLRDKREFPVLNSVEQQIFETKAKGEKLDDDTRISMETGFGADFGGVRVHTDSAAQEMSRELKAQAFTHGKDIYFASGKFEPESARGRNLLAHELTHVVQQGAAEQRVSPEQIGRNNASRTEPIPEPTDKTALQTQDTTQERIQQNEPELGEGPPSEGPQASQANEPGSAAAAEGDTQKEAGSESKEEGSEKKGAPAARKSRGKGKKKSAGKGKAAAAAGAVSAFLKKMTKPAFESKKKKAAQLAQNEKTKDPAEAKLAQTEKSVVPPAEEAGSQAKASQVSTVEQAPEPQPDEQQAKDQFQSAMEQAVPSTLEEVDKFKDEGKGRIVGEKVKEVVTADSQQVKGTYQEIENPPEPQPPAQSPEELPELETAPETAPLDMGDGVVGEVQPEHTDLSEFDKESDEMLQKEGIKEEYLDMVDEGDLAEARKERKSVKTKAKEGPKEVKVFEQQESQKVSKELKKEELEGKQKMKAERQKELTGAREDQKKTKTGIEQKRLEVTNHINGIYEKANTTVKQKLDDLEKKSLKDFDDGEKKATKSFEDEVKRRIDAFKSRRYDRFGGSLLWAKDKLFGMDDLPEVKQIFDSEKNRFISSIDALIVKITAENKRVIQECKELVANARKEIEKFVQGLGPELQKTGQEGLQLMKGKLDALDKQINDKEKELKKKLEAKREAAIKAIEEKIEKMKEEMSGLISKLGNLLLDAMVKFFKWALKKAGYASDQLMGIINKSKAVIKKIVTDPIGFIKNIVTAVTNGIGLFQKNIKKHLIGGLISWLTGAMADVPITLPTKFDLKGILSLVLQILGLTWDRIRKKLVKRLGEKVVKIAETSVDIIKKLIAEGPMGLWEMVKSKAAEIKQQVMDGIRNWIIVEVVKQGIIKLLSFLNPAGAIVQAILAIYNAIMFFVENWDRIVQFVKTVFGSIADIAMGKLSAASQAVERVLGMTIPIILNFMARLLGLSGIGKTITGIIAKIRKPIDRIVEKVIGVVAKMAKKLLTKVKAGAKKVKDKVIAAISWWTTKKPAKTKDGKNHTIQFKGTGKGAKLIIRSAPQSYPDYLKEVKGTYSLDDDQIKLAMNKAKEIETEKSKTVAKAQQEAHGKKILKLVGELAKLTGELPLGDLGGKTTPPVYGPLRQGFGTLARVVYMDWKHGTGSSPSTSLSSPEYDAINMRRQGKGAFYVKGHLLNENLGGPGSTWSNLTPLSQKANSDHKTQFENDVKLAVNGKPKGHATKKGKTGSMANFMVKAIYGQAPREDLIAKLLETDEAIPSLDPAADRADVAKVLRAEQFVPKKLDCSAEIADGKGKNKRTLNVPIENDISYGSMGQYSFSPSSKSRFVLAENIDFSKGENAKAAEVASATAKIQQLNGIGLPQAKRIYARFFESGRILSYSGDIGISKQALEKQNPRYRIVGGVKS